MTAMQCCFTPAYLIIVFKLYSQCCMQMCPEEDYSTVVEMLAIEMSIIRVGIEETKNQCRFSLDWQFSLIRLQISLVVVLITKPKVVGNSTFSSG